MGAKTAGIPRYRPFAGPALLRQGFRPFFLGAGGWALTAVVLWTPILQASFSLPTAFDAVAWHVHEMLFGFVVAAIAGFLLTAIPNWTGRMPLQGVPLAVLVGVWVAGRLAVGVSAWIGAGIAAVLDLSFLALVLGVVLREILAGRNWRNLPMPVVLGGLLGANALTHADAVGHAATGGMEHRVRALRRALRPHAAFPVSPRDGRDWPLACRMRVSRAEASFGNLFGTSSSEDHDDATTRSPSDVASGSVRRPGAPGLRPGRAGASG